MLLRISFVILFFVSTPIARALDTEISRLSLRGLKGVEVQFESLPSDVEQSGLTVSAMRTDVELKLRQAGIPILASSSGGLRLKDGNPCLIVNVSVQPDHERGIWAFVITTQLHQDAVSTRDPSIFLPAVATWDVGIVGDVTRQGLRTLRDDVKDQVDQFINAYLAVNPKK